MCWLARFRKQAVTFDSGARVSVSSGRKSVIELSTRKVKAYRCWAI
jgi:hypothetical protein